METRTAARLLTLLLAALPGTPALPAFGAGLPLTERAVLRAPDAMPNDHFGLGVALSRDGAIALVGAEQVSCAGGSSCGAVYAYFRSGGSGGSGGAWGGGTKLTASDAAQTDGFGRAIALSADGSTALIGAPGRGCAAGAGCGAVYVFTRSGGAWSQAAELTASDATSAAAFGSAVALSADGTTAMIGAPFAGCPAGIFCGAAYVFTGNGASWTQDVRLIPLDLAAGDNFGDSVALSADGTTALLGKPGDTCGLGFGCGASYIFMGSVASWTQIKKLVASDPQDHSDFGWSGARALAGATAVVGRPYFDCAAGADCGTTHVFTRSTFYSEVARLTPATETAFTFFGFSVALTDDAGTALLSAPGTPCGPGTCGAAYLFSHLANVWSQSQELTAAAPDDGSQLGISVGLANDAETAIAGANVEDCSPPATGTACGAAHIFAPLPIVAVPALGAVGMAVLAVLLAGSGTVLLRRRKAMATAARR
jgi:hypothetical protein